MKRKGSLLESIADIDNLRLAFWKSARGKQGKADVAKFRSDMDKNLLYLRENILNGNVSTGKYRYFTIYEPKERVICASAFDERVLQHALINICGSLFDTYQITGSYACRTGKGQYAALNQALINHRQTEWYLKLDVRKFFDTIDHNIMMTLIKRRIKDPNVLQIFGDIVASYCVLDGKGLPIGNLTSQYLANHYLACADHFVKEQLNVKCYVRYMDDMVLWSNNRRQLLQQGRRLQNFLSEKLLLNLKQFCFNKTNMGLSFLGYRIQHNQLRLTAKSKQRFVRKIKIYNGLLNAGIWTQAAYQQHTTPLYAFADKANTIGLKLKLNN
jgi:retron-type reverse transcriptase